MIEQGGQGAFRTSSQRQEAVQRLAEGATQADLEEKFRSSLRSLAVFDHAI